MYKDYIIKLQCDIYKKYKHFTVYNIYRLIYDLNNKLIDRAFIYRTTNKKVCDKYE